MVKSVLKNRNTRVFNPESTQDLALYKKFLETGRWEGGCPFEPLWPFVSVPDTINNLIINKYISERIAQPA
jgi:hypothetical protein